MLADPNDESPANVDAAVSNNFVKIFLLEKREVCGRSSGNLLPINTKLQFLNSI